MPINTLAPAPNPTFKADAPIKRGWGFFKNVLGAVFPAVGNIVNTFLDARAQKQSNQANLALNKQMMDYKYKLDQEQYDKALAYNTPEAQMKRFKAAGLNPNLIYGQGSAGTAPVLNPTYSAYTADMSHQAAFRVPELSKYFEQRNMWYNLQQEKAKAKIYEAEAMSKTNQAYAQMEYLWDEAYARSKAAGYKGQKSDFDTAIMREFQDIYGRSQADSWLGTSTKLGIYNKELEIKEINRKIQEKNLKYLDMGLPWLIPLNLIFGNLMRLK